VRVASIKKLALASWQIHTCVLGISVVLLWTRPSLLFLSNFFVVENGFSYIVISILAVSSLPSWLNKSVYDSTILVLMVDYVITSAFWIFTWRYLMDSFSRLNFGSSIRLGFSANLVLISSRFSPSVLFLAGQSSLILAASGCIGSGYLLNFIVLLFGWRVAR